MGWIAEQWSCNRPGTIPSLLRVPPPTSSAASSTVTRTPSAAKATAAASPLGPPPTTTAVLMPPYNRNFGLTLCAVPVRDTELCRQRRFLCDCEGEPYCHDKYRSDRVRRSAAAACSQRVAVASAHRRPGSGTRRHRAGLARQDT